VDLLILRSGSVFLDDHLEFFIGGWLTDTVAIMYLTIKTVIKIMSKV